MKSKFIHSLSSFTLLLAVIFFCHQNAAAQTWSITGNAGTTPGTNYIGTTDAKDFVFKTNGTERGRVLNNSGTWRFGGSANNMKVDSAGGMTFSGTGVYKVGANKYAFQYSANPNYGLFFNSTGLLYEFRTSTALSVFSIGANSGNGIFKGNLKVGAYTLPATDGSSGQVLKTNGTGTLTWSADNGTAYSPGAGISFAGSTINSVWTANGINVYNNNLGDVGINTTTPATAYSLTVGTKVGTESAIYIEDPIDNTILSCTKTGKFAGIYINKNYTGIDQTTTAAIEGHVNSNNYAVEGYHSGGSFGLIGGYNGAYVHGNNLSYGIYADSDTGYAIYGHTNGLVSAYFTATKGSTSARAVSGVYSATGSYDGVGVYGSALTTSTNYGYGGIFEGNFIGAFCQGRPSGYAGLYVSANGATSGIYLNGNFAGTGTNSYTSDAKLKKNIAPVENALEMVMKLKPSSYQFRVGEFGEMFLPSGNHYGVIAQDLQKVFPELVSEQKFYNSDKSSLDYLAVNYQELTPVLIAAIQEQQKTIDEQKQQLEELNAKNDAAMSKLNDFETALSQCCTNYHSGTQSGTINPKPETPFLEQNVPNPFSQNSVIKYYLPQSTKNAVIKVYSLEGVEMKSFTLSGTGVGQVAISGSTLTSGVYVYTLMIDGNAIDTKQMILTRE